MGSMMMRPTLPVSKRMAFDSELREECIPAGLVVRGDGPNTQQKGPLASEGY